MNIKEENFLGDKMREILLNALKSHYIGAIEKAKANIEIYLSNPAGIGDHPDIVAAASEEITKLSEAHDSLQMIDTYFTNKTPRI